MQLIPEEKADLATSFYEHAVEHPRATFASIARRVLGGNKFESAAFKRECLKMFNLARE